MGADEAVESFHPTLASARKAHSAGRLAAWSQTFLRGPEGNIGVADPLLREDHVNVYALAEVDLRDVYPCAGPDAEFAHPIPADEYESRVEAMMRAFEAGWDAPPLFVHMASLLLVDGTHRREALLRLGRFHYSAVMWMKRPPRRGRVQDDPPW
jgi:hypothetical protein